MAQSINIGSFNLYKRDDSTIYIERLDGEGGAFPLTLLESTIAEFYDKHF